MAANPEILNSLNQHVLDKTGVNVLAGGNPPTGGDKGKGTKPAPTAATPTTPPDKIPLPDYNDPKSRLNYTGLVAKKYNLPAGYGDTFTRFNETPDTRTDTLNTRQLISKTAGGSGLPTPLFYSSAMVEGMSGLYPYGKNNDVDYSGNEKFPVSGFKNFGLDTFGDAYKGLVKKGYLPADFNKQFIPAVQTNEQGKKVNSAHFATAQAALQAKAAMIKDSQDQLNTYATQNKIPLSDKAKQFLTLAYYNGGSGAGKALLQDFQREGLLKDDAFLTTKPKQSNYGKVYNNVKDRFQIANALTGEGYQFGDQPPAPAQQPTQDRGALIRKQYPNISNLHDVPFVDSVLNANKNKNFVQRYMNPNPSMVIKNPDGSSSTHQMASADNIAYPTIVQGPDGKLKRLGDDEAYQYARKTGEFIKFANEKDADWFANNGYKLGNQTPPKK